MVARNTVESSDTIPNSFVEGGRTGKYIMHTWYSVRVMRRGKAGVGDVVFRAVLKEGVLYSQFVGSENLEEIFTARITSWDTMWSESFLVFFAVSDANPCIDVATQDDLSGGANGTYHGVKECTELIMALVITGEVG
jgi:hypothetical protein